jgi:NTE family protein
MSTPEARAAALRRAASPVQDAPAPDQLPPSEGVALCLSGGGYRAMLFHAGALRRLNELGWLPKLDRVSSVSGGSITAAVLASAWTELQFDGNAVATNFNERVLEPIHDLAGRTIDIPAILLGMFLPGSIGAWLARSYRRRLLGRRRLDELPAKPRFVFNSTSLQSGVLRRFSKPYAWDWRVGRISDPRFELALAVAASSAFPPFLSPVVVKVPADAHDPGTGADLQRPPFTTRLVLTDGGVYDNLGLETAWKGHRTILVSDGGGQLAPKPRPSALWPVQLYRVVGVIDNQVRSLRKRQVIDAYKGALRDGAYWGIRTNIEDYELASALRAPHGHTLELAKVKTRLGRMDKKRQEQLVNWGYAVCDAAMRKHVLTSATPPDSFPYPGSGIQ